MAWPSHSRILDISLPVDSQTACFPGDTPFTKEVVLTYEDTRYINLTRFTTSPHVGTHADAPVHITGEMQKGKGMAGQMPLSPFIGPAVVVDVSPWTNPITPQQVLEKISAYTPFPQRVLFRTMTEIRPDVFEDAYASFSAEVAEALGQRGVILMGLDTPSVDPVDSKGLETHHVMLGYGMSWLENLDLTKVTPGEYFLIALPLKYMELEASPVRAILLDSK